MIFWGAGGHAKVVMEAADLRPEDGTITVIDDDRTKSGSTFLGYPVHQTSEMTALCDAGRSRFVICLGDNKTRAMRFQAAIAWGLNAATVIARSAVISQSAVVGDGSVVLPRAVINAGAVIGQNCIVNTACVIEHDCRIGDHAHISPGVMLGGAVEVGAFAHIGLNATVLPGCTIGEGSVVGAGAVVLGSVMPGATVVGVPAKPIKVGSAVGRN
jgi:UDP-perosamine 4-acetyltransferase